MIRKGGIKFFSIKTFVLERVEFENLSSTLGSTIANSKRDRRESLTGCYFTMHENKIINI